MTTPSNQAEAADPAGRCSKLSEEIIETQKCRSDMLKWKLILVAVLGAAGLGLGERVKAAPLILAIIPFVCVYVDLLCCNCNVRTILIGNYYARRCRDPYECFVARHRGVFVMEDWALFGSTILLCLLVAAVGPFLPATPAPGMAQGGTEFVAVENAISPSHQGSPMPLGIQVLGWLQRHWQGLMLTGAGFTGAVLSLLTKRQYELRVQLHAELPGMHQKKLADFLRSEYTYEEVEELYRFLARQGTFTFRPLPNGLYPAAASAQDGDESGYQFVWVRDNVHIAHAHYSWGDRREAARTMSALLAYFEKHRHRFENVIERKGNADPSDPMNRPHVRFDGRAIEEIKQKWPHAQNDALGYFLWCYCKLACGDDSLVPCGEDELECLMRFPRYFQAIRYWQDQDSGHWEEARKVSASSIGAVLAGLRELEHVMEKHRACSDRVMKRCRVTRQMLGRLQRQGQAALQSTLTCESTEPDCYYRRYDSALLFLIYPLGILPWGYTEKSSAEVIVEDVTTYLQGEHGIRRYIGDSYWCADYRKKLAPGVRTGDFSGSIQARDALLRPGEEAQWCIFDPIISVIYGQRYCELNARGDKRAGEFLRLQTRYFNRALSQLTDGKCGLPEFRCPEAYYLRKRQYVPNDHTPLLWAQANLRLAVEQMKQSANLR